MTPTPWLAWMLGSALSAGTPATPLPGLVLALERTDLRTVQALQTRIEAASGWWLELESQLLVVAPDAALDSLSTGLRVEQRLPALTPAALALQARGCGDERSGLLPAIAMAGRHGLVWAPRRFVSYATPDSAEWRSVIPNTVLARDQSLRGPALAKGSADPGLVARVAAVDAPRWFAAVQALAGFDRSSYGSGVDGARDWLLARFGELGLATATHTFAINGSVSVENVIATLPGSSLPDEWVVIGAHYDSRNTSSSNPTGTPGAEDNASGCAAVLEMARVLVNYSHQRTLKFVCFAGEEQGLLGSTAWAQQLQGNGQLPQVKLALIMDMIGYSGDADLDLLLETSSALSGVFSAFVTLQPELAPTLRLVTSTNPFGSDHVPFINRSVPSLLTIENDWDSYAHYHKSTDLPANMTRALDMGGGIVRLNTAVVAQAAGLATAASPLFADGFE